MLESGDYSAATTPVSVDDEKLLVPSSSQLKSQEDLPVERKKCAFPIAILIISCLQILLFALKQYQEQLKQALRFEPDNQEEIWRFATYMLVHSDWHHLTQNVLLQYLFAFHLEKHQKRWKVVVLYIISGATGALGASCLRPELVIGASAGVYGLLMSHLAHIIINTQLKYKLYRLAGVIIIVIFDAAFNVVHFFSMKTPLISWGAHVFGAAAGFLLGIVLFADPGKLTEKSGGRSKIFRITGAVLFNFMLFVLLLVNYRVRACSHLAKGQELVYFC